MRQRRTTWIALLCLCLIAQARPLRAYAVITHQAIIDAAWENSLKPALLSRFPRATPEELRSAQAYAYGGAVIQDLGYYPVGGPYFSHLTHYVRSGSFLQALVAESQNLNEYAFALGAISHYVADIDGHSLAVNRAVPLLYPRLRRKYGDIMTWEESPWAHSLTEFGFDTVEVVHRQVAPQKYHEAIGFQVPRPLLERAFRQTYGLEFKDETLSVRLRVALYRLFAARVVPEMSEVAWALRRKELESQARSLSHQHLYHVLHPSDPAWQKLYTEPGVGDKLTAMCFRLLPKFGPLNVFDFHAPTADTEQMFADSLRATTRDYAAEVKAVQAGRLNLPEINLDTGHPTQAGEYAFCDRTYVKLLHQLKTHRFAGVSPDLRASLLRFFEPSGGATVRKKPRHWRRAAREIEELKLSGTFPEPSPASTACAVDTSPLCVQMPGL